MNQNTMHVMRPVKRETLSARQYKRLAQTKPHLIERVRFVPPSLGGVGFGRFDVAYTIPTLRHAHE